MTQHSPMRTKKFLDLDAIKEMFEHFREVYQDLSPFDSNADDFREVR